MIKNSVQAPLKQEDLVWAPCVFCIHKHPYAPTCDAFPDKIPDEILKGDNRHNKPYPGDNDIQFEKRTEKE